MLNSKLTPGFARVSQGFAMRLRLFVPTLAAGVLAIGLASPALAQANTGADYATDAEGRVYGDAMPGMPTMPDYPDQARQMQHPHMIRADDRREQWEADRADWLTECRDRMSYQDNRRGRDRDHGLGGALIGGVAGGLIGNRVAGRGDRTAGTVIGTVAGAAVGTVIDRSDGAGNRDARRDDRRGAYRGDYCEQYFDYYTQNQGGQYQGGYGYGQQVMMVPVMMQQAQQRPCVETVVTEEWVTVHERRHRYIAPRRHYRAPVVHDKRLRM
jgi:uncharacterized protein YcfJ